MMSKKIHCIGIGGIGLSALAQYFLAEGCLVSGSDHVASRVTDLLTTKGASVYIGSNPDMITKDIDLVFYTAALSENHPELVRAREQGIQVYTYAQGLGMITNGKRTIAIAGSHGKTSTTAMIAHLCNKSNLSPTVIVGSLLSEGGTNFVPGKGDLFVVESCEYKKSFLEIKPWVAVVTNIDNDHLDYYGNMENLVSAFRVFVEQVPEDGYIIVDATLPYIADILQNVRACVVDVSSLPHNFELMVPGLHMQKNARLAVEVLTLLNVSREVSKEQIRTFSGTWRRSEYLGKTKSGALVFDDYAHHPTEIKVTLDGFKQKYSDKNIIVLFQPHLYSRTKLLFNDFLYAFDSASKIYVAPIYAAREEDPGDISSEMLVEGFLAQGKVSALLTDDTILELNTCDDQCVVISVGAGAINKVAQGLVLSK